MSKIKEVYAEVLRCLERGQREIALDYLWKLGFRDPEAQVEALRKQLTGQRNGKNLETLKETGRKMTQ
jgi:hypothetical protein